MRGRSGNQVFIRAMRVKVSRRGGDSRDARSLLSFETSGDCNQSPMRSVATYPAAQLRRREISSASDSIESGPWSHSRHAR